MEQKFVTGRPALVMGRTLVIADLHIGIEFEYYKSGIRIPSNTEQMKRDLDELVKQTRSERLVILGDVKHKVPGVSRQELREIPEFLEHFGDKIKVEILPGNHDSGLKDFIPNNVRLHSSRGFKTDGCFFFHGHTWPSQEFLKSDYVFVGHEHPQIEFIDSLGYRFFEPVWVRAKLDREKLGKKYKSLPKKLPELIIFPRFNRLSGGISMNRPVSDIERAHETYHTGIGTLVRSEKLGSAKVYLLDGTFLGELKNLLQ
ncbi:MAG: phosphoesterase [Candidatus Aenigmarchaeota archaeon]|nr:phosphoesterase [Candidatus Aenigmarchaeota archaeon]NIP40689.1 phosphoesterase [Candidatus Aenigmarchaeota archaeon]NIQ18495.1 phosphoesterase [Candidatus Aenigmarchaeota archaeon]NIS73394.1 phosphoesterase [Candidatus Aenigmarchaeota archaeon]